MSLGTSKSDCGKSTFFENEIFANLVPNLRDLPSFAGTRLRILRRASMAERLKMEQEKTDVGHRIRARIIRVSELDQPFRFTPV